MAFQCTLAESGGVETLRKSFGARVVALRKSTGMSQEELDAVCGFARSYMSRVERGTSNLSLDAIERLASGLKITVSKLFEGL